MRCNKRARALRVFAALMALGQSATGGPYDPPANYYSSATGTGATLKSQLRTIVSDMVHVSYGDARYSAPYTDADPNKPGNILLIYNRASVPGEWVTSPLVWNREHIWPQSRLGSASDSDQFNLRPANEQINSNRGNDPFGMETTTGGYGPVGSYWYPGDADAGDVARSQFYMATRYSNLSLVDSFPSGTQMGDLSSLVSYHFRDVPDDFERRRNHAIYGLAGNGAPAINNPYRQENRNPYVDHPEWVWSVFMDQQNDSRLYVGDSPGADGSSNYDLELGRVIVGAAVPSPQNVALTKMGLDGTYYEVSTAGAATSSVTGKFNAFPIITSGSSSRTILVGLNTSTATAGLKQGSVTIDNLDITTAGGTGRGANDENDTINVSLEVLSHANPSFSLTNDLNALSFDFGSVTLGSSVPTYHFDISNLISTPGFTAELELDSISSDGDNDVITTNLSPFGGAEALAPGATESFFAAIDTSVAGAFSATYTLHFSDENLPGAVSLGSLTLNFTGTVESTALPGDFDADGDVDGRDLLVWQRAESPAPLSAADLNAWQANYGTLATSSAVQIVPEPPGALVAILLLSGYFITRPFAGKQRCPASAF